ncbi:MAG: 1-acyl-sn-glycerol-3-phosphate acyltransferase [Bacteroidia bacterium]|nr:1-acyl-sn-glycerol-3-phosphate acyltransferase [Bacteroidia bacterium]HQU99868.1 lysophospholipid acyltransferase family protein [Bacteroidia bacterium]
MQTIKIIAGNIWRCWFFFNAVLIFFLLYPFVVFYIRKPTGYPMVFKLKKIWAGYTLFVSGINCIVVQPVKLDKNLAYIFCPNHASVLDIFISYKAIPQYFHFMGKAELKRIPFFRIFFKDMNIAVDRDSIKASYGAYARAESDLKKGISLGIFAEGTIPACTPRLGGFKNGAFKLAIENEVAIVPVTFVNTWKILPDVNRKFGGRPGTVTVHIHKPISTQTIALNRLPELRDAVRNKIQEPLRPYYIM